jgi:hypothetical protein
MDKLFFIGIFSEESTTLQIFKTWLEFIASFFTLEVRLQFG